jgi:DNA segregation ATPase FtsK/SpoIIIE, S-DNA-T family
MTSHTVLTIAAVVVLVRLAAAVVRFVRLPRAAKRYWLRARWYRLRWRWLCSALGLTRLDKHMRAKNPAARLVACLPFRSSIAVNLDVREHARVRWPKAHFYPDPFGWRCHVKLIPGISRVEFEKAAADYFGPAWGAHRVSLTEPKPGRLVLRALVAEPLAEPLPASVIPAFDGRHIMLGRDQDGMMRRASLAGHSGTCWAGNPGRGKTEAALSLAVQLASSPLVDLYVLDGGECDWQHFAPGAAGYVGADLSAAADMLAGLDHFMLERRRNLEAELGVRNAWAKGPTEAYRLVWILCEEVPFFTSIEQVKGDKKREAQVAACRGFLTSLLRRGRAPLFHTSLITQRATTTSLPSDIRDLCGLRWSFGCANTDSAIACLGDDIRSFPTLSPVQLQGDEHVGVACARLPTGTSPYTLLRFPAVGQALADETAAALTARAVPQLPAPMLTVVA